MILSSPLYTSSTAPTTIHSVVGGARRLTTSIIGVPRWRSRFLRGMAASSAASNSDHHEIYLPRTFLEVRTEQDLISGIWKEEQAGRLPVNVAKAMEGLYLNYRNAVLQREDPKADEIILSNMATVLDRVLMDVLDPFQFATYHKAIREPFDYYNLGQNFIRPLVDFRHSFIGNFPLFLKIQAQIMKIYVVGDRLITDPLCKTVSMGRNLFCMYPKEKMTDDHVKCWEQMASLLRTGEPNAIWISPSVTRDHLNCDTKDWYPAPLDITSLVKIRRLAKNAGRPCHIYPMAILTHDIMPPPQAGKEIEDNRLISFHGAGLSVGPSINYQDIIAKFEDPEEANIVYTQMVYSSICKQYSILNSAIHGDRGEDASTSDIRLSQPWVSYGSSYLRLC